MGRPLDDVIKIWMILDPSGKPRVDFITIIGNLLKAFLQPFYPLLMDFQALKKGCQAGEKRFPYFFYEDFFPNKIWVVVESPIQTIENDDVFLGWFLDFQATQILEFVNDIPFDHVYVFPVLSVLPIFFLILSLRL